MSAGALPDRRLVARFSAVLERVGAQALQRERERRLPHEEVALLRESGLTRATLPIPLGGGAADHPALFELLAELGRRDPNLVQLLGSHFAFADRALHAPASPVRDACLALLATGRLLAGATLRGGQPGHLAAGEAGAAARLSVDGGGLRLDGAVHGGAGILFADLVLVRAEHERAAVSVLVRSDAPGLLRVEDGTGFGQRTSGEGTVLFEQVRVRAEDVLEHDSVAPSQEGAFAQLVPCAAATGIARAVLDDGTVLLRDSAAGRALQAPAGGAPAAPDARPPEHAVLGELSALSFAADAALARAVDALAASSAAILGGAPEQEQRDRVAEAEAAAARAQLVVLPAVLRATALLFDLGGAGAVDERLQLDRHWRNARTIASRDPIRHTAGALGELLLRAAAPPPSWPSGEA